MSLIPLIEKGSPVGRTVTERFIRRYKHKNYVKNDLMDSVNQEYR